MYKQIIKPLREEIMKWLQVPVFAQNQIKNDTEYPYITYYMLEDWLPTYFQPTKEQYKVQIQFKVVSNNEEEQKELKSKLRRLFYLEEPYSYLKSNGVALFNVESLPSPPLYTEAFYIFDDGWTMTFSVDVPEDDFTIQGGIDAVNPNIKMEDK